MITPTSIRVCRKKPPCKLVQRNGSLFIQLCNISNQLFQFGITTACWNRYTQRLFGYSIGSHALLRRQRDIPCMRGGACAGKRLYGCIFFCHSVCGRLYFLGPSRDSTKSSTGKRCPRDETREMKYPLLQCDLHHSLWKDKQRGCKSMPTQMRGLPNLFGCLLMRLGVDRTAQSSTTSVREPCVQTKIKEESKRVICSGMSAWVCSLARYNLFSVHKKIRLDVEEVFRIHCMRVPSFSSARSIMAFCAWVTSKSSTPGRAGHALGCSTNTQ